LFILRFNKIKFNVSISKNKCMKSIYPKLRILSLDMEESEVGSSLTSLLKRFKISRCSRLAKAGGTTEILLWARVILVKLYMVTIKRGKNICCSISFVESMIRIKVLTKTRDFIKRCDALVHQI